MRNAEVNGFHKTAKKNSNSNSFLNEVMSIMKMFSKRRQLKKVQVKSHTQECGIKKPHINFMLY